MVPVWMITYTVLEDRSILQQTTFFTIVGIAAISYILHRRDPALLSGKNIEPVEARMMTIDRHEEQLL